MLKNYFKIAFRNIRKNKGVYLYQYIWSFGGFSLLHFNSPVDPG